MKKVTEKLHAVHQKHWTLISIVLLVAELAAFALLGVLLYKILPSSYMLVYGSVSMAILALSALWAALSAKSLKSAIVYLVITLLLIALLLCGCRMLDRIQAAIDRVTGDATKVTTEMVMLVLKDSEVNDLSEIRNFNIGYMPRDQKSVDHLEEELQKILITDTRYTSFENMLSLADALYAKDVNAIVLDRAYLDLIVESEGYESFLDDVRILYSTEIVSYINFAQSDKDLKQFVVYISGVDLFGSISTVSRSDVNLLLAVNTETKEIQMINTPRDYYIPLANSDGYCDKLTHAGLDGVDNSMKTLEMLYGVEIDYYLRLNFTGFEAIIDALGGIDVYSEYDFTVEPIKHYEVGINHVTGEEALAFARERYSFVDGDIQRGKNQMEVVRATFQKATSPEILYNYSEILDCVSGMLQTNMTSDEIYSLVRMQLADMASWDVRSYSVSGTGSYEYTYTYPQTPLSVVLPNEEDVEEAKRLFAAVLEK